MSVRLSSHTFGFRDVPFCHLLGVCQWYRAGLQSLSRIMLSSRKTPNAPPCGLLPRLLRDEDGVSEAHRCFAATNLAELSVVWSCQS